MTKLPERISFWGGLLQLIFGLGAQGIASWAGSKTVYAGSIYLLLGSAFWFFTYIHLRYGRLAAAERREEAELVKKYRGEDTKSIFEGEEKVQDQFSALVQLRKIERALLPILTLLLGGAYLASCFLILGGKAGRFDQALIDNFLPASIFVGVIAFLSFLYSKYVGGISTKSEYRLLKAASSALLSGSFLFLVITVTLLAGSVGYPKVELAVGKVTAVLLGLIGAELVMNFIISLYRPFGARKGENPVYYSRVVAMITGPQNIFRATASTLDYQFGFKVSETWFYQFLEKAAAPLFLFLVLSLYLLSSIVIVQPHERVIIERFGKPLGDNRVFGPGLHFKFPWPIDIARTFEVNRIQSLIIGHKHEEEHGHRHKEVEKEPPLTWTKKHTEKEFTIIVATAQKEPVEGEEARAAMPANLLCLAFHVHYHIRESEVYSYAYNVSNPVKLLENIAARELARYAVSADYFALLGRERRKAAEILKQNIQQKVDEYKLGIEIVFTGFTGMHPPVEVGAAYEAVVGAYEEKKSKELDADAEAFKILNLAVGESRERLTRDIDALEKAKNSGDTQAIKEAKEKLDKSLSAAGGKTAKIIKEAESHAYERSVISKAEGELFKSRLLVYETAPSVFKSRLFLKAFTEGVKDIQKYIYPSGIKVIHIMDFEEKEGLSRWDEEPAEPTKGEK